MFDPKKPYNEMSLLPLVSEELEQETVSLLAHANNELGKLSWLSLVLPEKDILIAPLLTKEAVSSSEIENIYTTTQSVLKADAFWKNLVSWPEKEVLHYRDAVLHWLKKIEKEWGVSTNTLIEIQWILEANKPWIRKIPWTIIASSTWEVIHTPPEWEDIINKLLKNLEKYYHENNLVDPLIKIAECHYQFETIHPFLDGNWRTWRIVMILQLLHSKKLEYPIIYLSEYIMASKDVYYNLFQHTRKTWNISSFINYILRWIIQQSVITQKKILTIQRLMETSISNINSLGLDWYSITKSLISAPYLSIGHLASKIDVTRQTASKYASLLTKHWIVETIKIKNSKFISLKWFISLLG